MAPPLPPPGWTLRDVERALVVEALRRTGYVQKEACKLLGVSRRKLNYMIQRMGITHPSWRRNRARPAGAPARHASHRGAEPPQRIRAVEDALDSDAPRLNSSGPIGFEDPGVDRS